MSKLGSLFDGIGGFPLAGQRHGITPVWASEIEKFPMEVTKIRFPDMEHLGDITEINGAEIEPVDVITFGSPCQDLSVAGKRAGLEGERSGLFMEAMRIIREMRGATNGKYPRFAVWENVPGAFSSKQGDDFRAVLEEITESEIPMPGSGRWATAGVVRSNGIEVAWRVLDAQYWGVPQRRKRIYLVADFTGKSAAEILFIEEGLRGDSEESRKEGERVTSYTESRINCTGDGITGTVSSKWAKGTEGPAGDEHYNLVVEEGLVTGFAMQAIGEYKDAGVASSLKQRDYKDATDLVVDVWDMTHANEVMRPVTGGKVQTLNARMGTGGNQVPVVAYDHKDLGRRNAEFVEHSPTLKARAGTGGGNVPLVGQNYRVRRLTPTECERLQGYPDGWTDIEKASDSARYKALGNSLAIPCAEYVLSGIAEELKKMA